MRRVADKGNYGKRSDECDGKSLLSINLMISLFSLNITPKVFAFCPEIKLWKYRLRYAIPLCSTLNCTRVMGLLMCASIGGKSHPLVTHTTNDNAYTPALVPYTSILLYTPHAILNKGLDGRRDEPCVECSMGEWPPGTHRGASITGWLTSASKTADERTNAKEGSEKKQHAHRSVPAWLREH